jgi:hypothetical protein
MFFIIILIKNQINIIQDKPIQIKVTANENVFNPEDIKAFKDASQSENSKLNNKNNKITKKKQQTDELIEISDNDDTPIAGIVKNKNTLKYFLNFNYCLS